MRTEYLAFNEANQSVSQRKPDKKLMCRKLSHCFMFLMQMCRGADLKEASGARRRASRRVDGLHPRKLLGKVPHIQLALQLRLERSRHLLLRQVVPVQALVGGGQSSG